MKNKGLNRRGLICGVLSVTALQAGRALAHEEPPFVLPQDFMPTLIDIDGWLPADTIHVFPDQFRLYLTLPGNQALRYTVGVGRPGLYHAGQFTVGAKQEWPTWRPTAQMIARDPHAYAQYADGMPGGPDNPLGARALYLYDDLGRDTALRIHGTNKPRTIGSAVSNGCARLTNDHIIDLYDKVKVGVPVYLYEQTVA